MTPEEARRQSRRSNARVQAGKKRVRAISESFRSTMKKLEMQTHDPYPVPVWFLLVVVFVFTALFFMLFWRY